MNYDHRCLKEMCMECEREGGIIDKHGRLGLPKVTCMLVDAILYGKMHVEH